MRHRLFFILIVILFTSQAVLANEADSEKPPTTDGTVRVGDIAPDFELTTLDGKPVCLSDCLDYKATVIVFWSFFCFPCQAEMPSLQEFYEENKDEVALVAIGLDGPQYDNLVKPFIAKNKLTFPLAYDKETDVFFEYAMKYGVVGTPTTFILDDQGRVRFIHLGRLEKSILKGIVDGVKSKSFCADIVKPTKKPDSEAVSEADKK